MLPSKLSEDVVALILEHRAALVIQARYRRHACPRLHFGHACHPEWSRLRAMIDAEGMLQCVYAYPCVRREWRTEPGSWVYTFRSRESARALVDDVIDRHSDRWGRPAPALAAALRTTLKTAP